MQVAAPGSADGWKVAAWQEGGEEMLCTGLEEVCLILSLCLKTHRLLGLEGTLRSSGAAPSGVQAGCS